MHTRRALLLAFGLTLIGAWSQDSARGQNSATPPVSLTPPSASSPHAGTKNSPRTSASVPSTPATSGLPQLPSPAAAADYDGFSVGTDDHDAPSQVTPPARSRAANGLDAQSLVDQEDEALKRKLTICKNCK
ncbi:hypothetical protein L6654_04790 [Bradyrhizobium sp. WYCCWR 13023]|uniref:Uncharacterized protein n=1 Tax=Bradyrhizobium zhengyangense TaxID=2911009 RepID=A0A9X1UF03_9BRAD|nr:hypothetical protein [Bradyrhizobium zhengyangense]MCG2625937.1 hypothetical protein [Bradyrhizobium zhengyangense]